MHALPPVAAAFAAAILCLVLGVAISFVLVRADKIERIQWLAGIVASVAIGLFVFVAARWGWF
jgi:hypothetical protein